MLPRAELSVLSRGGDLREHVLIDIALGVARFHRHLVEHVDDLREKTRLLRWQREARVFHVLRICRSLAPKRAQKRKNVLGDNLVHFARFAILELRPSVVVVRPALAILPRRKNDALDGRAEARSLQLFDGLKVVETPDEEEIGDLLDDLERVRDASRPKGIPDRVDLIADLSSQHGSPGYRVLGRSQFNGEQCLFVTAPTGSREAAFNARQMPKNRLMKLRNFTPLLFKRGLTGKLSAQRSIVRLPGAR